MARLSPEELQVAKKRAAEERAVEQKHKEEERALEQKRANEHKIWLTEAKQRYDQIESVVRSLYSEIDKLLRKWPTMPISQLTLEKTNKIIRAVRDLLKNEDDDFVEDITEIVPAGDLPETRDVVLILGQIMAALRRFEEKYRSEWHKIERQDEIYGY